MSHTKPAATPSAHSFALIANDPGVYFTTLHIDGYSAILVRLAEISVPGLEELVTDTWLAQSPKTHSRSFLKGR
jgi:hypothetical protein